MTKKKRPLTRQADKVRAPGQKLTDLSESQDSGAPKKGLNRRNFLGLSLAGAAVPLVSNPLSAATSTESPSIEEEVQTTGTCNTCPVPTPASAAETWDEPWVWEPGKWPGETLHLNVVEHQTPSAIVGLGNSGAALFSYNGATPGPTIRMKGDETLRVKLFNHLGLNQGTTPIGLDTDPAYYITANDGSKLGYNATNDNFKDDWELGEHVNGIHSIHTTNLHTHGLHVRPGLNTDGTHSDNIYLRVIPQEDLEKRETDPDYDGDFLLEGEQAGEAQYEFRLGKNNGHKIATHPPGTHWYHPHSHGSTNMEVASGMAGFLVVEGDVDYAINKYMTGKEHINTTLKTGNYGYRERLMMLQRVLVPSSDQDSPRKGLKSGATPSTNGSPTADIITMSPGDVERWRVLNGSVDGKGYVRFMVLEGQWVSEKPPKGVKTLGGKQRPTALPNLRSRLNSVKQLLYVDDSGTRCLPATADIENRKQHLHQLAQDGVTLVRQNGGNPEYYIKDLQNSNKNPLYQDYSNLEACYKNPQSLKACYNLSNELYMSPAQRADFFFEAPALAAGETTKVYTIIAKGTAIHTENEQRLMQMFNKYTRNGKAPAYMQPPHNNLGVPGDTIMAYIVVQQPAAGTKAPSAFNMNGLKQAVSEVPVPEYLYPITPSDVQIKSGDKDAKSGNVGKYRTRQVTYSGWGAATWPTFLPGDVAKLNSSGPTPAIDPKLIWNPSDYGVPKPPGSDGRVLAPTSTKTMAIDGKKFNPDDPMAPRPLLDTSEEWVVYNQSISLFGDFPDPTPGIMPGAQAFDIDHRQGIPTTRADADAKGLFITTRGIDHPFHIHTNPFWLMRVEVPDENGNLVNILPEPAWHDVMWIPRNGGRIVFRSRFPDFVGKMVNHCHILQHEDNGMMQEVMITQSLKKTNYVPNTKISNDSMSSEQVSNLGGSYTPESPADAYRRCSRVMDMNHMDSPDLPLAYEYPAKNGVFNPPSS